MVLLELGQRDEARARFEQGIERSHAASDRRFEAFWLGELARLLAHDGAFADARTRLEAAESILRALGDPAFLACILGCRAEVEALAGERDAGEAALLEAAAIAPRGNHDVDRALSLARRALGR